MPTTRVAVVTGASSGIGRATAAVLAGNGFRVIGTSRNPDTIPETDRLPGIDYRPLDLTDHDSLEQFVSTLDTVDVLVNNAGESQAGPLADLPGDAVARLFQLNVLGPIALTRALLPGMRQRGTGRVVMVGSMLASFPLPYRSSYVATKAALRGFATAARFEESPYGIWLTTVEPGQVDSGLRERRTKYLADGSPHTTEFQRFMTELDRKQAAGITPDRVARSRRGNGFEDFLAALTAAWTPDPVRYDGRFYRFAASEISPKPVRPGGPPVLLGAVPGLAVPAQRAGRLGFGFNPGIYEWAGFESQLAAYLEAVPQGVRPGPVVVRVNGTVTAEPLGSDRLPLVGDLAQVREDLARVASLGVDEVFWDLVQGGVPHAEHLGVLDRIVQLKD